MLLLHVLQLITYFLFVCLLLFCLFLVYFGSQFCIDYRFKQLIDQSHVITVQQLSGQCLKRMYNKMNNNYKTNYKLIHYRINSLIFVWTIMYNKLVNVYGTLI